MAAVLRVRASSGGLYISLFLASPLLLPLFVLGTDGVARREVPGVAATAVVYLVAVLVGRHSFLFTIRDGCCRIRRFFITTVVPAPHVARVVLIYDGLWFTPRLDVREPALIIAGRELRPVREYQIVLRAWSRLIPANADAFRNQVEHAIGGGQPIM